MSRLTVHSLPPHVTPLNLISTQCIMRTPVRRTLYAQCASHTHTVCGTHTTVIY